MTGLGDGTPSRADRLAILDCDGVLAVQLGSWTAIHEQMGTTDHQEEHLERYRSGDLDMAEWSRRTVEQWAGEPAAKLRAAIAEATTIPGLEATIDRLRRDGFVVGVVSAGVHCYVEHVLDDTPVDFVVSNRIEVEDGRLTGRADVRVTDRNKAAWFETAVERYSVPDSNVVLVGDSECDLRKVAPGNLAIAFDPRSEAAAATADLVVTDGHLESIVEPIEQWWRERSLQRA